jgi:hypothetical protein
MIPFQKKIMDCNLTILFIDLLLFAMGVEPTTQPKQAHTLDINMGNDPMSKKKIKVVVARRGSRTHDHKIKSLALYRLS